MMKPIDPAESLLAITDLAPVLGNDMPRVGIAVMTGAAGLAKRIASAARECVRGEIKAHRIPRREYSWQKMNDTLLADLDLEAIHAAFPPMAMEQGGMYQTLCQNVQAHLRELFPVQKYETFLGPKTVKPDETSVFRFFNQLNVLRDPLSAIDLIANGAMLKTQVEAMREIFPSISEAIDAGLYDAMAAAALVKSYRLPPRVESGIGTWLDRRTVQFDPDYGKVSKAPGPKVAKNGPSDLKTANQKALNP